MQELETSTTISNAFNMHMQCSKNKSEEMEAHVRCMSTETCIYASNETWQIEVRICTSICVSSLWFYTTELLSISLHPQYPPREFPQLFLCLWYIHPVINISLAIQLIAKVITDWISSLLMHSSKRIQILGDALSWRVWTYGQTQGWTNGKNLESQKIWLELLNMNMQNRK